MSTASHADRRTAPAWTDHIAGNSAKQAVDQRFVEEHDASIESHHAYFAALKIREVYSVRKKKVAST